LYEEKVPLYMIVCSEGMIEDYDALVLSFLLYDGKWLLHSLGYQKDEVEEEED